jgi:hypothetical protein
VVARTRDGGRSFDVLQHGLPQHHAYDLVWRHGLAVDETGDRLDERRLVDLGRRRRFVDNAGGAAAADRRGALRAGVKARRRKILAKVSIWPRSFDVWLDACCWEGGKGAASRFYARES